MTNPAMPPEPAGRARPPAGGDTASQRARQAWAALHVAGWGGVYRQHVQPWGGRLTGWRRPVRGPLRHSLKAALKVLLRGLFIILPIVVTLYLLAWLAGLAERVLGRVLSASLPAAGPLRYRHGMGLLAGLVVMFIVGLAAHWPLFHRLYGALEAMLKRVPLVKSVYGGVQDLIDLLSHRAGARSMKQVVALDIGDGRRMLGFVTQQNTEKIPEALGGSDQAVAVYLPMSYQIGGWTLFVPRSRLLRVDMATEEAMRFALTAAMSGYRAAPPGQPAPDQSAPSGPGAPEPGPASPEQPAPPAA